MNAVFRQLSTSILIGVLWFMVLGNLAWFCTGYWNPELLAHPGGFVRSTLRAMLTFAVPGMFCGLIAWLFFRLRRRQDDQASQRRRLIAYNYLLALLVVGLVAFTGRPRLPVNRFTFIFLCVGSVGLAYLFRLSQLITTTARGRVSFMVGILFFAQCIGVGILMGKYTNWIRDQRGSVSSTSISSFPVPDPDSIPLWVVGWDGAAWHLLTPMMKMGRLPNAAQLRRRGQCAELNSLPSLKSPEIWTTMATGCPPEEHGITGFQVYLDPVSGIAIRNYPDLLRIAHPVGFARTAPIPSTFRRVPAAWEILHEAGLRSLVLGFWGSWPIDEINGIMVSDRFAYSRYNPHPADPESVSDLLFPPALGLELAALAVSPDTLPAAIRRRFELERSAPEVEYSFMDPIAELRFALAQSLTWQRVGTTLLKQERSFDLAWFYFQGSDIAGHFFWRAMEPEWFTEPPLCSAHIIPEFYSLQDEILGDFLRFLPSRVRVWIVSDHGFGPAVPGAFNYRLYQAYRTHSGTHRRRGVWIAAGEDIAPIRCSDAASVYDICPTLLASFGLPKAENMPGNTVESLVPEKSAAGFPPEIPTYGQRSRAVPASSPADDSMKSNLRALGYIQ